MLAGLWVASHMLCLRRTLGWNNILEVPCKALPNRTATESVSARYVLLSGPRKRSLVCDLNPHKFQILLDGNIE
jgi:hypothetical protein